MNHSVAPGRRATRRRSTKSLLVLALAMSAAGLVSAQELPDPEASGIEHIVVVTMENRSFDHFLGWVPQADGRQEGLAFLDESGTRQRTFRLAPDYQGCAHPDPDHSYQGGRVEFADGACDGWLLAGDNDEYSIGFYKRNDLDFFAVATRQWTVCDRYFSAIMAETWPNKIHMWAGQTDRLENEFELCTLDTIWDRLSDAGVSGRYYFTDVPFSALWGLKYVLISRPYSEFLADAAAGTLPAVSFVDPKFLDAASGTSEDDHPHADVRNGQAYLAEIYDAITSGPGWPETVLVITYDEWGGFFDHVPPPLRSIPPADQVVGNDGRLGFRVPCIVISPFAPARVSSIELEHASILRMIEWRWSLAPLTVRDENATNLAEVLDFSLQRPARQYSVPAGPFGAACPGVPGGDDKWAILRELASLLGWPL